MLKSVETEAIIPLINRCREMGLSVRSLAAHLSFSVGLKEGRRGREQRRRVCEDKQALGYRGNDTDQLKRYCPLLTGN